MLLRSMVNDMLKAIGQNVPSTYWDSEFVVAEVHRTPLSKYVVSKCTKAGKTVINLREWYCTASDPNWKPSKNGITVPQGDAARHVINTMLEANAL